MDYFRKYLGAQPGDAAPSGAETVERLCDRVQSSTLLDDRRDAVRALKSLSKKFRLEVGTQSMEILIGVLQTDRADTEITGYALETLCNVMSNEPSEDDDDEAAPLPEDLGIQFTEMFVKSPDNISLLLSLLEEYDFHVRWPTVRLLTILLLNKGKDLQEVILVSPLGVSKLMDLLSDSREIIRNDGLLLLIQLTKGNPNIQKIVAFEGAFEKLLEIISEEGNSDGGIVVEDCLLLMLNLMKNNSSNQNFFKEGSFIKWLPSYFELESAEDATHGGWSAQKVTNIHLMLQLVRTLVSPSNPTLQIISCQKVMNQCGLLQQLCSILMASGVPADVLTETINTVSEVVRGNADNQGYFASVMAPSNPPRPAIVVLLMSMVNEKQPFVLRCAVLYCFQSFLYKNELGQSQIVQTLLPSAADASSISSGQLLCGGLFSADSLSTWLAAVALLHSIDSNTAQKEQLLRVQLATSLGNPPVSLLQQCSNILAQGGKIQTRIGLLMLICQWLANCNIAVTHFLHNPANVPFLISQVSASEGDENEMLVQGLCAFLLGICVLFNCDQVENYHKQQLRQVIEKRIGLERFTDKLGHVSKQEVYTRAAKAPHLNYKQPHEVLFDYEFTRLFKKMENDVLKAVSPVNEKEVEATRASLDQHDSIVAQYKELIREQDQHLNSVKAELSLLQAKHAETDNSKEDLARQVQQLKDQNSLLKTQRGSAAVIENGDSSKYQQELEAKDKQIEDYIKKVEQMQHDLKIAEEKNTQSPTAGSENHISSNEEGNDLSAQVEDLKRKVEQREEEVKVYRSKFEDTSKQLVQLREQLSSGNTEDTSNAVILTERNAMAGQIAEKDAQIYSLQEDKATLQQKLETLQAENATLQQKYQAADCAVSLAEKAKKLAEEDAENIKKEQEDLLVLLTDQDNKLKDYRERLKKHGEQVDEDDDDDDDLGDDFDDEDEDDDNVD